MRAVVFRQSWLSGVYLAQLKDCIMSSRLNCRYPALVLTLLLIALSPGVGAAQSTAPPVVRWQFTPDDGAVVGQALSEDGAQLVLLLGYGFDPGGAIVSLDPASGAVRWR